MAAKRTNRRVKQLTELLSVLRANGVTHYEGEGMKLALLPLNEQARAEQPGDPYANLTHEDIENWSVPEEMNHGA